LRDFRLYRWNPADDTETLLISDPPGDVFLNPTGDYAATAVLLPFISAETTFRIWDLTTSPATPLVERIKWPTDQWHSVAFNPNSQFVATGGSNANVRVWDLSQPGMPYREDAPPNEHAETEVIDLAYSPDGRYIAGAVQSVGDGAAFLRDATTGEELALVTGLDPSAFSDFGSAAFHPTENVVAFGAGDGGLWLWNIDELIATNNPGSSARHLIGHTGPLADINFSPDGNWIVTASWDQTVRLWDYHTGETIRVFEGHTAEVWAAVFDPQGEHIVSTGNDCTIRLWDVQTGADTLLVNAPRPDSESSPCMVDLAFSPADANVLAGSCYSGDLYWLVLAPSGLQSLRVIDDLNWGTWHIAFNREGTMLASAGQDGALRLWGVPAE
jgi:WD40 repeat protein